jgi:ketosteroid isomerase-like protein
MSPTVLRTAAWLAVIVLGLEPVAAKPGAGSPNRTLVADAFEQWALQSGSPFELLADDATWTILGPTPTAGIYTLPRLREELLAPFQARLETPLMPQVRAIHEDGDTVIVLFEASG